MIKIEFKEATRMAVKEYHPVCTVKSIYKLNEYLSKSYMILTIKSVSFGCASELVPSRSEVLTQLGITKEQDEANQIEWSKL